MICIQLKIKCKIIILKTLENGLNKSYFMTYQSFNHVPMYLFVLLILSIFYFIFGWKHDPYGKYKHESYFIKIGLYSTYVKKKITLY